MDEAHRVRDINRALRERRHPSATTYNRLEGRPRAEDFDRALRAELRDPLWLLSRQWQLGEFRGDDAGSPVLATLRLERAPVTRWAAGAVGDRSWDDALPAESRLERRPVPLEQGGLRIGFDLRLAAGRRWLNTVAAVGDVARAFIDEWGLEAPDPDEPADLPVTAHVEAWQYLAAVASEAMDGVAFAQAWREKGEDALDGLGLSAGEIAQIGPLAEDFADWVDGLVLQPGAGEDAWVPPALEYRFEVTAEGESGSTRMAAADGYPGGRLDWYSVDVAAEEPAADGETAAPPPLEVRQLIPTPLAFTGMPERRWWQLEDRRTDLGSVGVDTTDIGRLLLLEFALVSSDDWFLVPLTLPAGGLVRVRGLAITTVFGERFWIEPAGQGADDDWQRWGMFGLAHDDPGAAADVRLLVLPTAPSGQDGAPLEEVLLTRDEMANLVWGIETQVPLAHGRARRGAEAADETRRAFERLAEAGGPPPPAGPPVAPIRYELMSRVPEHWIPFLPVHVPGSSRDVQLQRGALLRLLENDPLPEPARVRPRTSLLREGLDAGEPYFVHEEEVPRSGVRIAHAFQRCRWYDGRAVTWLAAGRRVGRGEGSSGLTFDRASPVD